ncbi:tumor necrosis factor receptor superfamily member 10B isoform X3 [Pongo pygmaeus]|uniref:TNF receptor superfamily member 10b n=1 Tax=Pongo abelii TaxID=9601 RepID=H2PPT2_PONAB|nr:tumor necrosis factor receptor superfamily member 10B isoform X3 [Pongo abelii]XP_054354193.1 tumor necrosis factor receptor superfamily member 10B isoform X3 [Pongo pygmaeus]PNJ77020.1 TNFRSF10B isoform 3 [Pongo abelii]
MEQRGQNAPAASGARKRRGPGPREVRGAGPGLRVPKTLVLVVAAVLLLVSAESALITQQDLVPQQRAAPQQKRSSPSEGLCPPGHHISEDSRDCISCKYGQDYSTHWNDLLFCLRCTKCDSGEVEVSPCTTTRNTVCQCEEGTFREEDSPEMCRKCRTGCPRGMAKVGDCTPWSDIECVHKESGIIIGVTVLVVVLIVAVFACTSSLWKKVLPYLKGICSGGGGDPERLDRSSHSPQRPGAEDNALNEIVSILQPTQVPEQEMEVQEPAEPTGVNMLSPGESEHLPEPEEAEGSQRRRLLVPANEGDPTETLRQCFDDFADMVPFDSWEPLMRKLGLMDNEIKVAKAEAAGHRDTLYTMLIKWVNKTGRDASVHTLLDALEAMGERLAKQKIEDHLLSSGKFMYLEGNADSAMS